MRWVQIKGSGAAKLIPSEAFMRYEKDCGWFIRCKGLDINCRVNIRAIFYIDADRTSDLTNYMEALADMLVHYGVIRDDNRKIIVSWDGSRVYVDRKNPRTEVTIEPLPEESYQIGLTPEQLREEF
jgi:Holliday junction resolvase RusA-like endonuclease